MTTPSQGIYTFPGSPRAAPASPLWATLEQLERSPTDDLRRDPSMQASYRDPDSFFAGLLRALRAEVPALRSQPGVGFDLYFDLCLARSSGDRVALRSYNKESGWESLTYRELALGASRLAARWQRAGAKSGTPTALLAPMGPELLVGLLAGYKLGLLMTLLPPTSFVGRRLLQSGCARVATTPLLHQVLSLQKDWVEKLLPPIGGLGSGPELAGTHLFPDDAPANASFSLSHSILGVPLPLPARQAFLLAVRDGLLGLRLREGDALACVGGELLQYQPALLLAVLIAGATYVHIEYSDLVRDPRLIAAQPLRAVVLSAGGAVALGRGPRGLLSSVRALFCDAAQGASVESWRASLAPLGELPPIYALLYESAVGGATMWSGRQGVQGLLTLLPAPGVPFELKPVSMGPGSSPLAGAFLAAIQPWGSALLVDLPAGNVYLGTLLPRRSGHTFPTGDVLEVVHQISGIDAGSVVDLPPIPGSLDSRFHLVAFVGPSISLTEIGSALQEALVKQLPASSQPDAIVPIALYARRKDGAVDTQWVRTQYLQGRLQRKAADPLFARLAELRELVRLRAALSEPASP